MENPAQSIIFRQATLADVEQLCPLLALLFEQEADFQPDRSRQERGLRLLLKNPEFGFILCATANEMVKGMVSILFTPSLIEGGLVGVLEDMVVHPEWRRRGIGSLLLQEALGLAQSAGCTRVMLLTDDCNHEAQRFYQRAGFVSVKGRPWRLTLRHDTTSLSARTGTQDF